jgi:hypothetical protein
MNPAIEDAIVRLLAERDTLAAKVDRVEALADRWRTPTEGTMLWPATAAAEIDRALDGL